MSSSELPPRYNFSAYQGDRKDREFAFFERIWDPDANGGEGAWVKGDPKVLPTNIKAEIRTEEGELKGEFTVTVYDQTASPGRLRIRLTPTLSDTLEPGSYLYDIEATGTDPEDIDTLLRGKVKIVADVTE